MRRESRAYLILVVDDEPPNVELLRRRLTRAGYDVITAGSAAEARAQIAKHPPNLMLLDICMPEVSGVELLRELRELPGTRLLPIIMVTGLSETENIVEAIQNGANDYVTKPINMPVLLARMETQLRMSALVMQLESQAKILSHLAAFDELTGLYNRRSLTGALEAQCASARLHAGLSLLMIDIDHFKGVNDRYGHAGGDAVLLEFARRLAATARDTDIAGRWGGEEFLVLLPEADEEVALTVAERIRACAEEAPFVFNSTLIPVTVSLGIATLPPGERAEPARLIETADHALYEAKRAGRNRVHAASGAHAFLGGSA